MKEIYYGGSFDPFHIGHELLIKELLKQKADRLIIAVAGKQDIKKEASNLFSIFRYLMTVKSLADIFKGDLKEIVDNKLGSKSYRIKFKEIKNIDKNSKKYYKFSNGDKLALSEINIKELLITDEEIMRSYQSYTYISLEQRTRGRVERNKDIELCLAHGSDFFYSYKYWKNLYRITELADFIIVKRSEDDENSYDLAIAELRDKYAANVEFINCNLPNIASSQIRKFLQKKKEYGVPGLAASQKIDFAEFELYLTEASKDIITKYGLYYGLDLREHFDADFINYLQDLEKELWTNLSLHRLAHTVSVMYAAIAIALVHKVELKKAALAGLMHDMAKEINWTKYKDFVRAEIDAEYLKFPSCIHGPLAAYLMKNKLNIDDEEVLQAVRSHVFLNQNPSSLDLVIYLADKIEISRAYKDLEPVREMAKTNLLHAVRLTLDNIMRLNTKSNKEMIRYSIEAYKAICKTDDEAKDVK